MKRHATNGAAPERLEQAALHLGLDGDTGTHRSHRAGFRLQGLTGTHRDPRNSNSPVSSII